MSISTRSVLGSVVALTCLASACSSSKKVDMGGGCLLNSDCNSPLSCSFGTCHTTCADARDCPLGQDCVKTPEGSVCQLPVDSDCQSSGGVCPATSLVCAADQRCRAHCQAAADCLPGQGCSITGACADSNDLDANGQIRASGVGAACLTSADCNSTLACAMNRCHYLCQGSNVCPTGQSCVKTGSGAVCQLPGEAQCDATTPCAGGLVCAADYRCRAACTADGNCTIGQKCAGGVCADSGDLNPSGQLTPKNPPVTPVTIDGGVGDVATADLPVAALADAALDVAATEAGLSDAPDTATAEARGVGGAGGAGGQADGGSISGTGGSQATGGNTAAGGSRGTGGVTGVGGAGFGGSSAGTIATCTGSTPAIVYADDFEGGIGLWYADNGVWEVGAPEAGPASCYQGSVCAGTVLAGNYPNSTTSRLISPAVTLPALSAGEELNLRFWGWFAYAFNGSGQVQVSIWDAGTSAWGSWQSVAQPVNNSSGGWDVKAVDLTSFAGKQIRVGFLHTGYSSYVSAGWYLDGIQVVRFTPCLQGDFESGWGDWCAENGVWQVGLPSDGPKSCHEGAQCAATILDGNYPNSTVSRLISPSVALPAVGAGGQVQMRFWNWFAYAFNGSGQVQVSDWDPTSSTWSTWTSVDQAVTNSSGNWTMKAVDLTAHAGKKIRVAFTHTGYSSYVAAGWYVDSISFVQL